MLSQQELQRDRYIEACITKARIEAELLWDTSKREGVEQSIGVNETLSRGQVAELLCRSRSWVRDKEANGMLPRVPRLGPKTVRYYRTDVERLRKKLVK
jgi:predicted DNA-binding transcriptional regulator AlpA